MKKQKRTHIAPASNLVSHSKTDADIEASTTAPVAQVEASQVDEVSEVSAEAPEEKEPTEAPEVAPAETLAAQETTPAPAVKRPEGMGLKEWIAEVLKPDPANLVVAKEIEINGNVSTFHFQRHSYAKCSYVDAKQYRRGPNGQLIHDIAWAETVGIAHQLFETVVHDINAGKTDDEGKPLEPDWVRFFTIEELLGKGEGSGIMGNQSPYAKEFIYKLINAVWEVVPEWNVVAKSAAIEATKSG